MGRLAAPIGVALAVVGCRREPPPAVVPPPAALAIEVPPPPLDDALVRVPVPILTSPVTDHPPEPCEITATPTDLVADDHRVAVCLTGGGDACISIDLGTGRARAIDGRGSDDRVIGYHGDVVVDQRTVQPKVCAFGRCVALELKPLERDHGKRYAIDVFADGSHLLIGRDVFEVASGKKLRTLDPGACGDVLAVAGDEIVATCRGSHVWMRQDGSIRATISDGAGVGAPRHLADSRWVFAESDGDGIVIDDVAAATQRVVHVAASCTKACAAWKAVAVTPAGKVVRLSAAGVLVFQPDTGEVVARYPDPKCTRVPR